MVTNDRDGKAQELPHQSTAMHGLLSLFKPFLKTTSPAEKHIWLLRAQASGAGQLSRMIRTVRRRSCSTSTCRV